MQSLSMCCAKNAMSSGRSSSTARSRYLRKSSARLASSFKSAKAISGSIIQNSARWRVVFEFSAQRGTEGVDAAERQAIGLDVQLAGDSQAGLFAEKVFRIVDGSVFIAGKIGEVERRYAEHGAGALGIAGADDGRANPEETALMEITMDGHRQAIADPRDRSECVGARPQVRDGSQVFHAVPLGGNRVAIRVLDRADHGDAIGLDLKRWPLPRDSVSVPSTCTAQWVVRCKISLW